MLDLSSNKIVPANFHAINLGYLAGFFLIDLCKNDINNLSNTNNLLYSSPSVIAMACLVTAVVACIWLKETRYCNISKLNYVDFSNGGGAGSINDLNRNT